MKKLEDDISRLKELLKKQEKLTAGDINAIQKKLKEKKIKRMTQLKNRLKTTSTQDSQKTTSPQESQKRNERINSLLEEIKLENIVLSKKLKKKQVELNELEKQEKVSSEQAYECSLQNKQLNEENKKIEDEIKQSSSALKQAQIIFKDEKKKMAELNVAFEQKLEVCTKDKTSQVEEIDQLNKKSGDEMKQLKLFLQKQDIMIERLRYERDDLSDKLKKEIASLEKIQKKHQTPIYYDDTMISIINSSFNLIADKMGELGKRYTDNSHKYTYNKTTNVLTYPNHDNNLYYTSNFILDKLDLPTNYKDVIKDTINTTDITNIYENITIKNSAIDLEIENVGNSNAFFVLPSQLNGAEYIHIDTIIKKIADYRNDRTGGPRGQLAVHPAVGQFILDNAANAERPIGINGVKNVILPLGGVTLKNGYLQVEKENESAETLLTNLEKLIMIGMTDVPVDGYYYDRKYTKNTKISEWNNYNPTNNTQPHKVNLIYASAVPIGEYNNIKTDNLVKIANYIMIGEYYGALQQAYKYKKINNDKIIKIYLMPLGGGVFKNKFDDIIKNIAYAVKLISNKYDDVFKKLDINVLTFVHKPDEYKYFLKYKGVSSEKQPNESEKQSIESKKSKLKLKIVNGSITYDIDKNKNIIFLDAGGDAFTSKYSDAMFTTLGRGQDEKSSSAEIYSDVEISGNNVKNYFTDETEYNVIKNSEGAILKTYDDNRHVIHIKSKKYDRNKKCNHIEEDLKKMYTYVRDALTSLENYEHMEIRFIALSAGHNAGNCRIGILFYTINILNSIFKDLDITINLFEQNQEDYVKLKKINYDFNPHIKDNPLVIYIMGDVPQKEFPGYICTFLYQNSMYRNYGIRKDRIILLACSNMTDIKNKNCSHELASSYNNTSIPKYIESYECDNKKCCIQKIKDILEHDTNENTPITITFEGSGNIKTGNLVITDISPDNKKIIPTDWAELLYRNKVNKILMILTNCFSYEYYYGHNKQNDSGLKTICKDNDITVILATSVQQKCTKGVLKYITEKFEILRKNVNPTIGDFKNIKDNPFHVNNTHNKYYDIATWFPNMKPQFKFLPDPGKDKFTPIYDTAQTEYFVSVNAGSVDLGVGSTTPTLNKSFYDALKEGGETHENLKEYKKIHKNILENVVNDKVEKNSDNDHKIYFIKSKPKGRNTYETSVFLHIYDKLFKNNNNIGMLYVVSPFNKIGNEVTKDDFLFNVEQSAININKVINEYNKNEEKKIKVVRVNLISSGASKHTDATKVDVATAIIEGILSDFIPDITYEFSYDEDSFKKAYEPYQAQAQAHAQAQRITMQVAGGGNNYYEKYVKYKTMYLKLKLIKK
jgi:hypothetical protein